MTLMQLQLCKHKENPILWLLRDARFVTGQIIRVDGGRSLAG